MINSTTRTKLGKFIHEVNEPYDMVQKVSFEGQLHVHIELATNLFSLHDATRRGILSMMEECWEQEQDYDRIREWGRAMIGFATILALNTEAEAKEHWTMVSDAITRIAHWQHSDHHFYAPMNPYAVYISTAVWSDLSDLYGEYGESDRIVYHNGQQFKLAGYGPKNCRICIDADTTELRPTGELFVDPDETRQLQRNSFEGKIENVELLQMIGFDQDTMQAL